MIQALSPILFRSLDLVLDADLERPPPGSQLLRTRPLDSPSFDCRDIGLGSKGVETVLMWSEDEGRDIGCAETLLTLGALNGDDGRLDG